MGERGRDKFMSKGPICVYLDKLSRLPDAAAKLGALHTAIAGRDANQPTQVAEILDEHLLSHFVAPGRLDDTMRTDIVEYLERKWFGPDRWWQHIPGVADTFARGLTHALEQSLFVGGHSGSPRPAPLPITSAWVVVGVREPADSGQVGQDFRIETATTSDSVAMIFMSPWPEKFGAPLTLPTEDDVAVDAIA